MKLKFIVFLFIIQISLNLLSDYNCAYTCNTNPLMQMYPNQNMCVLLAEIPNEFKNLSYVMYPNCDIYNTNRFGYNKLFNYFPHAIIVPTTFDEVRFVLQVIKKYNLQFTIRSGGHAYEPASLSNGYIIDLRNFNEIIPDITNQTVYIGTGAKLGNVIQTLGEINFAIPTGTCPSVGIGGLALGGGIGELARPYGLTSDAIINIKLLTANDQIITVDENNYPDLFFALRGAGANSYGIILGFTLKMFYTPIVSFVTLTWSWDPALAPIVFDTWQKWFPTLPDSITSEIVFKYDQGKTKFTISSLKVGAEPLDEWINTFSIFNPIVKVYQGNYLGAADLFASNYTLPFSKAKSKFTFKPICIEAMKYVVDYFNLLQASQETFISFLSFGSAFGGAISNGSGAYFPRKAFEWVYFFMYWKYQFQSSIALYLINQIYRQLEPFTSPYSYANLIDYDLGKNYLHAYYGTNVNRLIQIKNIYDPTDLFKWHQGIPLSIIPQSQISFDIVQKYCSSPN